MELFNQTLPWVQIILSLLLIGAILLQQSGASVGGAFGGQDSGMHYSRRGFEKILFRGTIILAILFAFSAFVALLL